MFASKSFAAPATAKTEVNQLLAFVNSGVNYIKKHGSEKAFAEINNPNGQFRKGDLYLFVYDFNGVCLAHGYDPQHMVGKNLYNLQDKFGTPAIKLMLGIAKRGGGFVTFYWPEPSTGNVQLKTAYFKPLDNKYIIGAGLYKLLDVPQDQIVKLEALKAFVNAGIDYIKNHGEDAAYREFDEPYGEFRSGDWYMFVINYQGTFLAYGMDPKGYVDKNFYDIKDAFGTPIVQLLINTAKSGGGVVSYYWSTPTTGEVVLKSSYVKPLNDNALIGAGIYGE